MDSKLITIAIHTYEKAQMLCSILESEGIRTAIQHINPEQASLSAGVRVKINETDLPKALRIVEDLELMENYEKGRGHQKSIDNSIILVPVDFSMSSNKIAEWAIRYAADAGAGVLLLHAYYSPFYVTSSPYIDGAGAPALGMQPEVLSDYQMVEAEMKKLVDQLYDRMKRDPKEEGALPQVSLHSRILHGVPEDVIIEASREIRPALVIVGSHGRGAQDHHGIESGLMGSVTAEVIDRCSVPVLVVPENAPFQSLKDLRRVAFATSFAQSELVHFDAFMEVMRRYKPTVFIFNISARDEREILKNKTEEVRSYFKRHYPHTSIGHEVLKEGDRLEAIIDFIEGKEIQLVALPVKRKGMLKRLFNMSLPNRLLMKNALPMLVFNTK